MKSKETKRAEAEVRQAAYDKLTSTQKLAKLDKKLGTGVGAKKERAQLQKIEGVTVTGRVKKSKPNLQNVPVPMDGKK